MQVSNDTGEVLQLLPNELDASATPIHVAIIMDGNARWAKRRGMSASMGHEAGVRSLPEVIKLAKMFGVRVLTVFAFSTENWLRPKVKHRQANSKYGSTSHGLFKLSINSF